MGVKLLDKDVLTSSGTDAIIRTVSQPLATVALTNLVIGRSIEYCT